MDKARTNILVVDDDSQLLDLLVDTLNAIGYQATGVLGGSEALEKLGKIQFDLMITDIKMPGMDGIALLRKAKRRYPNLPVLFITGVASPEIIGRGSPDGFLAKPFRISHMEEMIENALTGKADETTRPIRKVMVVDDNQPFREMLSDTLRHNGFTPLAVEDGEQALRELENGAVDAVVSDIKMPRMDGITLLKKIKERRPDLPVILVTAFFSREETEQQTACSPAGADGFLRKPFKIETIIDLLNEIGESPAAQ